MKRCLEVAELVLLAAAGGLAAALIVIVCRRSRLHDGHGSTVSCRRKPPLLPLSQDQELQPTAAAKSRHLVLLLTLLAQQLCSSGRRRQRQRARIEPAAAAGPQSESESESSTAAVASWRLGPASRALYTIDEEDEQQQLQDAEEPPETPFYTPAASPARLIDDLI